MFSQKLLGGEQHQLKETENDGNRIKEEFESKHDENNESPKEKDENIIESISQILFQVALLLLQLKSKLEGFLLFKLPAKLGRLYKYFLKMRGNLNFLRIVFCVLCTLCQK